MKMTQLIKQSWISYPNIFFSGMPASHLSTSLWNKRKCLAEYY